MMWLIIISNIIWPIIAIAAYFRGKRVEFKRIIEDLAEEAEEAIGQSRIKKEKNND